MKGKQFWLQFSTFLTYYISIYLSSESENFTVVPWLPQAEVVKKKAQMEQQIVAALREEISLERALLIAKSRKPRQLAKSVWYENAFKDSFSIY